MTVVSLRNKEDTRIEVLVVCNREDGGLEPLLLWIHIDSSGGRNVRVIAIIESRAVRLCKARAAFFAGMYVYNCLAVIAGYLTLVVHGRSSPAKALVSSCLAPASRDTKLDHSTMSLATIFQSAL